MVQARVGDRDMNTIDNHRSLYWHKYKKKYLPTYYYTNVNIPEIPLRCPSLFKKHNVTRNAQIDGFYLHQDGD